MSLTKYAGIESSFTNACNYNLYAHAQEIIATNLFNNIPKEKYNNVLELGAGYGLLTNKIKEGINYTNLEVNDLISGEHITLAGNMLEVDLPKSDLITSSSALHWLEEDLEKLVTKVAKVQSANDSFIFATFIKGNVYEVETLGVGLKYFSVEEINELLSEYYEVEVMLVEELVKTFDTPIDALREFKFTGTTISGGSFKEIRQFKSCCLTYKYCIMKCTRR